MGDSSLRCEECGGKLGGVLAENRCVICYTLNRLRSLLLSERFPASAAFTVSGELRSVYWRALEVADHHTQVILGQGGVLPPGAEPPLAPGLSGKAPPGAPPGSLGPPLAGPSGPPAPPHSLPRVEGVSQASEAGLAEAAKRGDKKESREKDKKRARSTTPERKRKSLDEHQGHATGRPKKVKVEPSPTPPKDRRERTGNRSSGHKREEKSEPEEEEEEEEPSEETEEKEGQNRRETGGTGARPRSPDYPPPERSSWEGPIPAYRRGRDRSEPIERRKFEFKYTNKGQKKRRQQQRLRDRRSGQPSQSNKGGHRRGGWCLRSTWEGQLVCWPQQERKQRRLRKLRRQQRYYQRPKAGQ